MVRSKTSRRRPVRASRFHSTPFESLERRTLFSSAPVGVNIDALTDYSTSYMFVDAMKTARAFGSPGSPWDAAATVDANGWPTEDSGACIITVPTQYSSSQQLPDISGTYHFSATGFCNVGNVASNLIITNWNYDAATNTTTADVNVAKGATQVYLNFTGTTGGVQNIKLIHPGYASDTTQVFTNSFLNSLANVQAIRTMDFLRTNNNPVVNWSDRSHVTDALQTSDKGAAWEYVIDLANETHKDVWINIPVGATGDYVTQLATLLKANLDPSLHVYVEYSNEVWNSSFSQFNTNYDAAQTEEAANPSLLNYDNCNNTYYYAWRRIAEQIVNVSQDFAAVYGQSAINTTIRPVLASQIGWGYVLRNQLEFMAANYGSPSNYIYAVAGAPYINIGDLSNSTTLTVDQIFSALQSSITSDVTGIDQYQTLSQDYGVKELFYEGGVDLEGNSGGNIVPKIDANYDSRMTDIINQYLTTAYSNNVEMVMYYSLSGAYSPSGTWGLTEDLSNLSGPKFTGFTNFATAAAPALTGGFALPSAGGTNSLDGGLYLSDMYENAGTGGDATGGSGNTYDYMLNAQNTGTYALNITAGEWNASNPVDVYVDGNKLGTITLAGTGSQTVYATSSSLSLGSLAAGVHTLRLVVSGGGYGIHTLNFTNSDITVAAPANLVATASSSSQVNLTWGDVSSESGFAIERSLDGVSNWSQIATTAAGITSYADQGLNSSTTYYYRVRAIVAGGYTPYSSTASATTLAAASITLTASQRANTGISLGWTKVTGAANYIVQRLTSSGTWENIATLNARSSSYLDSSVVSGTTYTYQVVALDTAGNQLAASNLVTCTFLVTSRKK